MSKKLPVPIDPLIFQVAGEMAATTFEAMLSSGLDRGKYKGRGDKPVRMYVKDHIEKFIPIAVKTLIEMLKPTSNCSPHMRERIFEAITNPINDKDLMEAKVNPEFKIDVLQEQAKRTFEKNKIILLNSTSSKVH